MGKEFNLGEGGTHPCMRWGKGDNRHVVQGVFF
jgi:hypothetical protein